MVDGEHPGERRAACHYQPENVERHQNQGLEDREARGDEGALDLGFGWF